MTYQELNPLCYERDNLTEGFLKIELIKKKYLKLMESHRISANIRSVNNVFVQII